MKKQNLVWCYDWYVGCWNHIFSLYGLDYNLTTYENNFLFTDSFGDVLISFYRDIYATDRLLKSLLPVAVEYKVKVVLEDYYKDIWEKETDSVAKLLTYVELRTDVNIEKIIVTANGKEHTIY